MLVSANYAELYKNEQLFPFFLLFKRSHRITNLCMTVCCLMIAQLAIEMKLSTVSLLNT